MKRKSNITPLSPRSTNMPYPSFKARTKPVMSPSPACKITTQTPGSATSLNLRIETKAIQMECMKLAKQIINGLRPSSTSAERVLAKNLPSVRQPSEDTTGSDVADYTPHKINSNKRMYSGKVLAKYLEVKPKKILAKVSVPRTSFKPDTSLRSDSTNNKLTQYLKNLQAKKAAVATDDKTTEKRKENKTLAETPSPPLEGRNNNKEKESPKNTTSTINRAGKITDYVVSMQIGQGAYAIVKQGTHKLTGRKVAIKVYEKYKLIDPQRKTSVNREIQILKKLNHPHIVKLQETIDTVKQLYLVMELVKGKSMHLYVHAKPMRRLEEAEAILLFKQVLEAIEHCHKNLVSHRDIKSENILVTPEGEVKLIDFGFGACASSTQKLKIFCGTPSYMSPEIVNRKEYLGPSSDIWSLGVLFYFMLSGNVPFRGGSERELFRNISRRQVVFPAYFSGLARGFILQMLQVDPTKRPTATEVLLYLA